MKNAVISVIISCVVFCFLITVYHFSAQQRPDAFKQVHSIVDTHVWKFYPGDMTVCTAFHVGDGILLTAAHCVNKYENEVWYPPGVIINDATASVFDVVVVSADKERDIAVLHSPNIVGDGLKISDNPVLDQQLFAVGAPGPLKGQVVVMPVRLNAYSLMNEVTAHSIGDSIWPGMSGGPLLDETGTVYGVIVYTQEFEMGKKIFRSVAAYSIQIDTWLHHARQPRYTIGPVIQKNKTQSLPARPDPICSEDSHDEGLPNSTP